MKQTLKLYPSPTNYQYADRQPMPWSQFRAYIDGLVARLPEGERPSVQISRMQSVPSGVELTYEHELTAAEVMEQRREKAVAWLQNLRRDALTDDERRALQAILGA